MISKELLSEVLGKTVDIVYTKDHVGNDFKTFIRPRYGDFLDEINIYELAHKCKEWAFKNGYALSTSPDNIDSIDEEINPSGNILYWSVYANTEHIARKGTEPEAIFKACQWILDNKDK